jgi:SAM-dependent methyltransferase
MLHLAREGFDVTGVDSSPAMLALARRRLELQKSIAGRIHLVEDDFKRLRLNAAFPLVILPFNTFSHMTAPGDARTALETFAAHLTAGGRVALALPNPIPAFGNPPEGLTLERTFRDEARDTTVQQFSSLRVDRVAQLGFITWIYDEIDGSGTVKRTTAPMTLRYFFPNELAALFEQSGLRLTGLWGDYDRSPYTEDSPVLIAVGLRAEKDTLRQSVKG